jgi:hypothetical protein
MEMEMTSSAPAHEGSAARGLATSVYAKLQSDELGKQLALADPGSAAQIISTELAAIDPAIQLHGVAERARGPMRELVVEWAHDGRSHEEVIVLPMQT